MLCLDSCRCGVCHGEGLLDADADEFRYYLSSLHKKVKGWAIKEYSAYKKNGRRIPCSECEGRGYYEFWIEHRGRT